MESSKSTNINFIIWSDSKEDAISIASLVTGQQDLNSDGASFSGVQQGVNVHTFLRGTKVGKAANPINGVADCLIVHISGESETASDYINERKTIPLKVVVSSSDLSAWASQRDSQYESKADDTLIQKLIKSCIESDLILKKSFDIIDINGDGYISKDELLSVSKTLGHELSNEEANDIGKIIAKDGKIPYDKFKNWWFCGRTDFKKFRNIVEMEISMNNMVQGKNTLIEGYLSKLNKDITTQQESFVKSIITIKPKNDFENGVSLSTQIAYGSDGKSIIEALPDYHSSNPVTISIELSIDDAEQGTVVIETLNGAKDMIFSMVPGLEEKLAIGIGIKFRHVGTSVFIDFTFGGQIAEMMRMQMSPLFNTVNPSNFSGLASIHLISGIQLGNVFDITLEEILDNVSKFKIEGNGETKNLKAMIEMTISLVKTTSTTSKKMGMFSNFFKLIGALRTFSFTSEYDSTELTEIIKEIMGVVAGVDEGHLAVQVFGGQLSQMQMMGKMQLEGIKAMAGMFLAPYMEVLNILNFDRISLSVSLSLLSLFYKFSLEPKGLTQFLRENIFS